MLKSVDFSLAGALLVVVSVSVRCGGKAEEEEGPVKRQRTRYVLFD